MSPLLGLDYGTSRVGIAVSGEGDTIAFAVGTHRTRTDGSLFDRLQRLIDQRDVTAIVIGLPLTARAAEEEMAGRVRTFARKLETRFELPVFLVDERFTSLEADRYLKMSGRRHDKAEIDALAAEIILQQFLDRRQRRRQEDTTS